VLTPDERAALVVYCHDHPVGVCPRCSAPVTVDQVRAGVVLARRDACPTCRTDLTAALRQHLADCTWIRVQRREVREHARELHEQARQTTKRSHELHDRAHVLAREAEVAKQTSRDVKRGTSRVPENGDGHVPEAALQLGQAVRRLDRSDIGVVVGIMLGAEERALVRWVDGSSFEVVGLLIEVGSPAG
jgi:hypothetical protein